MDFYSTVFKSANKDLVHLCWENFDNTTWNTYSKWHAFNFLQNQKQLKHRGGKSQTILLFRQCVKFNTNGS